MKKSIYVICLVLIFALAFSIMSFAVEEPVITATNKVYFDYSKSNDNNGLTPSTAKKTLSGATDILVGGGTAVATGKLYIGGNYTLPDLGGTLLITSVDGDTDYKNATPANNPSCAMKMYTNVTFTLQSDVIIDDIILFQETTTSNVIKVTNNSTLVIGENVVSIKSPHSQKDCYMSIEVEKGSTVIVKGGTFQRITGDGTIINTGATVIEGDAYILRMAAANALYTLGIIDDIDVDGVLGLVDAKVIIDNLTGYEDASFENSPVSEAEFLTELLKGLGVADVTTDNALAVAKAFGLADDATSAESFTRGRAFDICVKALDFTMDDTTLAEKLVANGSFSKKTLGYARRIALGEKIIVACVGDSITEGAGSTAVAKYSYPARLQELLGNGFEVVNCGKSGAYVMNLESQYNVKAEERPDLWYPATPKYETLMTSSPDIVIVMLGTNDARSMSEAAAEEVFIADYKKLIADIAALESDPEIYLSSMIPAVNSDMTHQGTFYTLPVAIKNIANELGLPYVDTSASLWKYYYAMLPYGDSVHPTDETYPALAVNFYNQVFGYNKELPAIEASKDNVVYLSSKGNYANGGTSLSDAVDTLGVAVAKLANSGGIIVVCDEVDVKRTHFVECGGEVTITSVYGGVDYRKTGAKLNISGIITLLSDVKLENVNIHATASSQCFNVGYNNFTVGDGVVCTQDEGVTPLSINAGYRLASGVISAETVSCHEDCTITVKSGTWDFVRGGNNRTDPLCPVGTVDKGAKLSIYISGGTFTHVGTLDVNTATGKNNVDGEVYMEISGGDFAGDVAAVCNVGTNKTSTPAAINGDITLKILGGTFGGRVALYHSDSAPRVSGNANLVVARTHDNVVDKNGYTSVEVIDVATLLGDSNNDGTLNLLDALRIVRHLTDSNVEIAALNADFDKDGELTVKDVLLLLKSFVN